MKILTEAQVDFKRRPSFRTHDRQQMFLENMRGYCGKQNSNIGCQYVRFQDGLIKAGNYIERSDIAIFQWIGPNYCINAFVELSGDIHIDHSDVELTPEERQDIKQTCKDAMADYEVFIEKQQKFVGWIRQNKQALDGLTPGQVLDLLKEKGFEYDA